MKKIYTLFMLSFLSFSSSLAFADERHDAIINEYARKHSCEQKTFYTLDEIVNINEYLDNTYLVLTGEELINKNDDLNGLLRRFPDMHIVLDVQEADGLVENGLLNLDFGLEGYERMAMRMLIITNFSQDVKVIGDNFLNNCFRLTEIDLSSLSQVAQIGNSFLANCFGLTKIDWLSPSQVTQIGDNFLLNCTGLTEIDLSYFNQVTQIGRCFLANCAGLTELDSLCFSELTQIGDCFLANCSGLERLDLSYFNQVTQIEESFLMACSELIEIDQVKLPRYNAILNNALIARFSEDTSIGRSIREIYVDGHYTPLKNTKSARK
jgi:hypothetical protein